MAESDWVNVVVVTQEMLLKEEVVFDMLDFTKTPKKKFRKDMTVREFRDKFATEHGVKPEGVLIREIIKRKNKTSRVGNVVSDLTLPLGALGR